MFAEIAQIAIKVFNTLLVRFDAVTLKSFFELEMSLRISTQ